MSKEAKMKFMKHHLKTRAPLFIKNQAINLLIIASLGMCAVTLFTGL